MASGGAARGRGRAEAAGLLEGAALPDRPLDKATWIAVLRATGLSDADMDRWHFDFERLAPAGHRRFLELLGLPPAEIEALRAWAATGGV